ncbi:MAG: DUF6603 domain-containing protein [Rhodothermales bacterium]|nr:DUF6603 domain-containing protein [Rhodothermales bacterium]
MPTPPRDLLQHLSQPTSADLPVTADWGPVHTFIAAWIPAGVVLRQPAVESSTADDLWLTGTLAQATTGELAWPAGGTVRVHLTLLPPAGDAAETLKGDLFLQAPANWKFGDSFPLMPKTTDLRDLSNPTQTPILDGLAIRHAWLVFSSHSLNEALTLGGQAFGAVTLAPGLNAIMRMTPAGVVGALGILAAEEVTLAGPIVRAGGEMGLTLPGIRFPWEAPHLPGIHLTAAFSAEIAIGASLNFRLGFGVYSPLTAAWLTDNPALEPVMALFGDLALPQAGVTARLAAERMLGQSDTVEWLAEFAASAHEGIDVDHLAALIGDGHTPDFLKTHLPDVVARALAAVSLKGLTIEVVAGPNGAHRVANTGFYVGVDTGKVTLIEGVLSLDAIEVVEVIVRDPFGSSLPITDRLMGAVVFNATFLDASVLGMVALPDFSIEIQLAEAKAIPIGKLFEERGLDANLRPADLVVEEFVVRADLEGTFSIAASIAAVPAWSVVVGGTSVALEEVAFNATRYSWGDKEASFSALLRLGDPDHQPFELLVSADVRTGAGAGWRFRGALQRNEVIAVGALVERLAHHFGVVAVPKSISDLVVDEFHIDFDTGKKDFSCAFAVKFPLDGEERHVRLGLELRHRLSDGGYDATFDLTLGTLRFQLIDRADLLLARYAGDVTLNPKQLAASLSATVAQVIPDGIELTVKEAFFLHQTDPPAGSGGAPIPTGRFLFGIELGARLDVSRLPLVGQAFSGDTLVVDRLNFLMASAAFTSPEITTYNQYLAPDGAIPVPEAPKGEAAASARLPAGPSVSARLSWSGHDIPLFMAAGAPQGLLTGSPAPPANTPPPAESGAPKWYTVERSFGPVHLSRVGAQLKANELHILLDGGLGLGDVTLSLMGLSVGSPLAAFKPEYDLQGLGLAVDVGSVGINGAFLHIHHDAIADQPAFDEYAGAAGIRLASFALGAIGSYASLDGHPSLFVYAVLDMPIGGPAFFFVTGLAAGFGYNRALRMPGIDQVAAFPLVQEAVSGATGKDIATELKGLQAYLPPSSGDRFFAIGIRFSSFKLIDSFALLAVSWGHQVEVDVLGLSTLVVPVAEKPGEPDPLARVQLALKATFLPDPGFLGVSAQLTPASYILSKACQITGGFGFYSWFGGPHEGDFALSIGGYHRHYQPPAHYPQVPRLGFNWQVSDELSLSGQAYFALVPSAIMAGGRLEAVWKSDNIKAWFIADADFLLAWKPYHYEAEIYVDVGVSYTFNHFGSHTFTADVGADLSVWGPDFAGTATIHLAFVSFTISFGPSPSTSGKPIDWTSFKTMLPAEDERITFGVAGGLIKQGPKRSNGVQHLGVIHPKDLAITIQSAVPASQVTGIELVGSTPAFGIPPMDVRSPDSMLSVTFSGPTPFTTSTALLKRQPSALWGSDGLENARSGAGPEMTDPLLCGIRVAAPSPEVPDSTPAITPRQLGYQTTLRPDAFAPTAPMPWLPGPLAAGIPSSPFADWPTDTVTADYFEALIRPA